MLGAGAGAGGQAPHGSVIGAGTDTPMTAVPVAGAPAGNDGVSQHAPIV